MNACSAHTGTGKRQPTAVTPACGSNISGRTSVCHACMCGYEQSQLHARVVRSHHGCMWWYSDVYLKPVAQALHPCTALCFNADRLCRPARVQAAPVLLPSLKHILLDPAPQLKAHLCLIRLVPCLHRKDVEPVCQCIVLPDRTQIALLHLCWLLVGLSAACISRHQRLS